MNHCGKAWGMAARSFAVEHFGLERVADLEFALIEEISQGKGLTSRVAA